MIITGNEIKQQIKQKRIFIEPYSEANVTTNSYDFHLGSDLLVYEDEILDCKKELSTKSITIPDAGYVLEPGTLYLGSTIESIGSNEYVPMVHGKSSTGRIGLFIHITADIIDIGSINQFTLMLNATQPVKVYKNMKIGQVTFWKTKGEIRLYDGKYNLKPSPQSSKVFLDFHDDT